MLHRERRNVDLSCSEAQNLGFTPTEFGDFAESCASQQIARGARGDHAGGLIKTTQRSQIEMIKVRVGHKDQIDLRQLMKLERRRGQSFWTDCESRQTNSDPGKEDGIGENCYAEKIDEHCG